MDNYRRTLLKSMATGFAMLPMLSASMPQMAWASADKNDMSGMSMFPNGGMGNEEIIMVLYPKFTALDLVGPQYMFASMMGAKVHLAYHSIEPVICDTGFSIMPTITFDKCPEKPTVLFVPGAASGLLGAIKDKKLVDFLSLRGKNADFITSVCTGSMLLGAAGLLEGYKATSHWVTHDLLPVVGAIPVKERVVIDRNRITAAGVSAGLDFGLQMVDKFRGTLYAQSIQLLAEYDPHPHLDAGTVDKSSQEVIGLYDSMFKEFRANLTSLLPLKQ